jgi:hypothetical protein
MSLDDSVGWDDIVGDVASEFAEEMPTSPISDSNSNRIENVLVQTEYYHPSRVATAGSTQSNFRQRKLKAALTKSIKIRRLKSKTESKEPTQFLELSDTTDLCNHNPEKGTPIATFRASLVFNEYDSISLPSSGLIME